jgi:hypothetical protein
LEPFFVMLNAYLSLSWLDSSASDRESE